MIYTESIFIVGLLLLSSTVFDFHHNAFWDCFIHKVYSTCDTSESGQNNEFYNAA